eukprot:g15363.t1
MVGFRPSTSTSAVIVTASILVSLAAGAHVASRHHLRHLNLQTDDDSTRDYEHLGCYRDNKRDRVLGHKLTDDVNVKADDEMCGGKDAFDLYCIGTNTSGDDDDDGNHGDDDSGDDDSGDDDSGDDDSGDDDSGDDDGVSTPSSPLTLTPSPVMGNGDDYGISTPSPATPTPSPVMDNGDDDGVSTSSPVTPTPSPVMDNGDDNGVSTPSPLTPTPSPVMDDGDDDGTPTQSPVTPTLSPVAATLSPITPPSEPENAPVDGAFVEDIVKIIDVEGDNPRRGWEDSYSVDGKCFMYTTFDHAIGGVLVDTPLGEMTIRTLFGLMGPGPGAEGRPLYNDIQCGNGPVNNARDEPRCPGLVEYGRAGCGQIGPKWDLSEIRFEDDDYPGYP